MVANANRAKGPAAKVEDFIPRLASAERQTPEEMYAAFRAVAARTGGK